MGADVAAVHNQRSKFPGIAPDVRPLRNAVRSLSARRSQHPIRNGELCLSQNKTGRPLRIAIVGELKDLIERILAREHRVMGGDALLQDGNGQRLTDGALRTRFNKAREAAGVSFQFRDIRAKTATDTGDLARAQKLLGHKSRAMTEHYTRNRKGDQVSPLK